MNLLTKTKIPIIIAIFLLIPIYIVPVWWVSLTAPNYPVESFPDGVKINFHMNGVFNGCEEVESDEISEDERLDCVHEMDTINHYVGMYPIAAGGPILIFFSIFMVVLLAVMLIGYLIDDEKRRIIVMSTGFFGIAIWLSLALYLPNGLNFTNGKYLEGRVNALGQEGDTTDDLAEINPIVAALRASLAESGVEVETNDKEPSSPKEKHIAYLKDVFESNQRSLAINEGWEGTGIQLLGWHYRTNLARYFNDPAKISPMVYTMVRNANLLYGFILFAMIVLLFGSKKTNSLFHKLLILIPIALPILFIVIFAAWLSWYGHNLNDMGAFTLKPFMPTVFGQGKVAQFTTHSYPNIGFLLMLLFSALLSFSFFAQSKQLTDSENA
jgi:hypothetical protein